MAMSNRTTKILWGKAGATCSFPDCRRKLVADPTELDGDVVLGEIAHIVAQSKDGPRGEHSPPGDNVDSYENLILLCGEHHKLVDGQPNTYPVAHLLQMREDHEQWVSQQLATDEHSQPSAAGPREKQNEASDRLRVFLCHSSSDKPSVRDLYQRLSTEGVDPWLDEEKLLPGQDWGLEIAKAVRRSHVVVVCLSRTSISQAGYVQKEIRYALDAADEQPEGAIFIIPLRLEECEVPERLRRWQWVDLFSQTGYERLVLALGARADSLGVPMTLDKSDAKLTREQILEARKHFQVEIVSFDATHGFGVSPNLNDYIRLRIINNSDVILPFLTVNTKRYNRDDQLVGASRNPPVPTDNLKPGESAEYDYYPKGHLPGVVKMTVEIEQLISEESEQFIKELEVAK